ncbi:pentatricopeptide repeat-containing protein [Senna tora]|uniref:Pentatricopeptide repeat-containing protein n=1 Tax=Senna tora TaxID=362788 RepID=A0A834WF04_9FABA|nr:pentatricopeptide repeat-containing protein [Senna tora]
MLMATLSLPPDPKIPLGASSPRRYDFRIQKHPPTLTCSLNKTTHRFHLNLEDGFEVSRQMQANASKTDGIITNKLAARRFKNRESLDNAHKMFEQIPNPTLPTYAALIGSYCRLERWDELFTVLGSMINEDMLPDKYLVPTILKACSSTQLLRAGKMIHAFVTRKEMDSDVFIGNALIHFYSSCGDLKSSVNVFDTMKVRDVVSWTALVSAYMDEGLLDDAKEIFNSMHLSRIKPDLVFWNALISGFARNGETALALKSLQDMQEKGLKPQVNTWNGIISGCAQNGLFQDALHVLSDMLCFPEKPNSVTISSILPACSGLEDLDLGRAFHGYAIKHELGRNYHVEGSLIGMYSKCQKIDYAEKVFREAENKNTSVWNEMIAAYVDEGKVGKAMELLRLMQNEGLRPDLITYNILLAGHARYKQTNEIHRLLSEMDEMAVEPNIISWNVLISGFQQRGLTYEALKVFQILQAHVCSSKVRRGLAQTNSITIASALSACADLNLRRQGKEIHGYSLRKGFESNIYVSSALVEMYMKSEDVESATKVFRKTVDRNTISWNNLIAGCIKNRQLEMAMKLFYEMLIEGHKPSPITFLILLPAVSMRLGRQLHAYVVKSQFQELENNLASALEDMYAKSAAAAGCSLDLSAVTVDFWLAGPKETLTSAGLKTRSLSKKPRLDSSMMIPSLYSWDSSRAMASFSSSPSRHASLYASMRAIKLDGDDLSSFV